AEDGIRDRTVTGVQTCALPIWFDGRQADRVGSSGKQSAPSGTPSPSVSELKGSVPSATSAAFDTPSPSVSEFAALRRLETRTRRSEERRVGKEWRDRWSAVA